MAILSSKPITTNAFGIWWLKDISLIKTNNTAIRLTAQFIPYNGTYTLNIQPKTLHVNIEPSNNIFNSTINLLFLEIQRQYSLKNSNFKTLNIKSLIVRAQDPARPVVAFVQLMVDDNPTSFVIQNVFSLASTDETFSEIVSSFIEFLGNQAKLKGVIE